MWKEEFSYCCKVIMKTVIMIEREEKKISKLMQCIIIIVIITVLSEWERESCLNG